VPTAPPSHDALSRWCFQNNGRPKAILRIFSDERAHLLAITRSRPLPAALTLRAKIVLACERESSNAIVAPRLGVGPRTIGKWRNRFIADRIAGLYDEMRSGRLRGVEDEAVADLITTPARKPKTATHWSMRAVAKKAVAKKNRITKSTVHRLFQLFGLQPHRTRKLSTSMRRARSRPSNAPGPRFHAVWLHRRRYR
jgi:putative transposase